MGLNSSPGHEQGLGDLPVQLPGRRELGDAQFAGRERVLPGSLLTGPSSW
jgi:hypothetical protein